MKFQEKKLWQILVPRVMGGWSIDDSYHEEWDKKVAKITGGLTLCNTSMGKWVDANGDLFQESVISVNLACTEEEIKEIMKITLQHYCQDAIFVSLLSEKVLILNAQ